MFIVSGSVRAESDAVTAAADSSLSAAGCPPASTANGCTEWTVYGRSKVGAATNVGDAAELRAANTAAVAGTGTCTSASAGASHWAQYWRSAVQSVASRVTKQCVAAATGSTATASADVGAATATVHGAAATASGRTESVCNAPAATATAAAAAILYAAATPTQCTLRAVGCWLVGCGRRL